uniref:Uncharacterized protein n=1 Tax=Arundo donax TaxID=35708 RepID=A0A0A9DQI0_ARUDO
MYHNSPTIALSCFIGCLVPVGSQSQGGREHCCICFFLHIHVHVNHPSSVSITGI